MDDGSWVGLDVHARKVVAGVLDGETGELRRREVPPRSEETVRWLAGLPAPVRVAYEAGPTGFGLARACEAAGIACLVAAPSKIPRPSGDRVKTDRRDAERLARLLRLGELTAVRVPSRPQEAARDLVRAREDVRSDLMRARHRLSKLLLRHERLYEGEAWTKAHDAWLRRQRFSERSLTLAFEDGYEAVLRAVSRRAALDAAIVELAADPAFAPIVARLVCLRGVATLTALALTVELGDWERFEAQSLGPSWDWCRANTQAVPIAAWVRSPRPATATPGACSSRPPGSSAGRCDTARLWRSGEPASRRPYGFAPRQALTGSIAAGGTSRGAASCAPSSPWPWRASSPATAGLWPRCRKERCPKGSGEESAAAQRT